jgi:hypothetical protein
MMEKFLGSQQQQQRNNSGKSGISPKLRAQIWETYMGVGNRSDLCPLCGTNQIQSHQSNSGFQACHVVADKWMSSQQEASVYYLFPGCAVCNNECADVCLFDFLFARGRHAQLRAMITAVFKAFSAQHQDNLSFVEGQAWRVLDHLYGPKRFPAGGGIQNTQPIYEVARRVQMQLLLERIEVLSKQVKEAYARLETIASAEIKTMRL